MARARICLAGYRPGSLTMVAQPPFLLPSQISLEKKTFAATLDDKSQLQVQKARKPAHLPSFRS